MNTSEAIACLDRYQTWRRGDIDSFSDLGIDPTQIGIALDTVLAALRTDGESAARIARLVTVTTRLRDLCGLHRNTRLTPDFEQEITAALEGVSKLAAEPVEIPTDRLARRLMEIRRDYGSIGAFFEAASKGGAS